MTIEPHADTGKEIRPYDPDENIGLEDIEPSDLTMPRITINHGDGLFTNNLSGEEMEVLRCVILGVVKQRVMWDESVDDGDRPECKSPDFHQGFPNVNYDGKTHPDKQFPWARSNFDAEDFPAEKGVNGLVTLPCSSCIFKEWNKEDWTQPPCSEVHTYPLLYQTEDGGLMPALLSVQKTGIKPSRTYLNVFAQSKKAMFTVWTEIRLTQQSRGTVKYSVPYFRKKEETQENQWAEFAEMYRSARAFLHRAPRNDEYVEPEASDNVNRSPNEEVPPTSPDPAATAPTDAKPVQTTTTATSAPVKTSSTAPKTQSVSVGTNSGSSSTTSSAGSDDDELPF